jgi:hypothetical protein
VYRDEEGVKEKQLLALEDGCMRERRRKVDECKKVENIGSINGGTVQYRDLLVIRYFPRLTSTRRTIACLFMKRTNLSLPSCTMANSTCSRKHLLD